MAVSLTSVQLANALRLGSSAEETAEVTRLLTYSTTAVTKHAPNAPDEVLNEAAIRLSGYLFDQPNAGRGMAYANALRNSGAGAILLPYRVHRAGHVEAAEAVPDDLAGSLRNVGFELVNVQSADTWTLTSFRLPGSEIGAIAVDDNPLTFFRTATLGPAATAGESINEPKKYHLGIDASGQVLFGAATVGEYSLWLYAVVT